MQGKFSTPHGRCNAGPPKTENSNSNTCRQSRRNSVASLRRLIFASRPAASKHLTPDWLDEIKYVNGDCIRGTARRRYRCALNISQHHAEAPLQFRRADRPASNPPPRCAADRDRPRQARPIRSGLLPRRELRSGARRLDQLPKSGQPFGVVTVQPVPQSLSVHATGLRRRLAVRAVEYQCKRKHPRTVLLAPRCAQSAVAVKSRR